MTRRLRAFRFEPWHLLLLLVGIAYVLLGIVGVLHLVLIVELQNADIVTDVQLPTLGG